MGQKSSSTRKRRSNEPTTPGEAIRTDQTTNDIIDVQEQEVPPIPDQQPQPDCPVPSVSEETNRSTNRLQVPAMRPPPGRKNKKSTTSRKSFKSDRSKDNNIDFKRWFSLSQEQRPRPDYQPLSKKINWSKFSLMVIALLFMRRWGTTDYLSFMGSLNSDQSSNLSEWSSSMRTTEMILSELRRQSVLLSGLRSNTDSPRRRWGSEESITSSVSFKSDQSEDKFINFKGKFPPMRQSESKDSIASMESFESDWSEDTIEDTMNFNEGQSSPMMSDDLSGDPNRPDSQDAIKTCEGAETSLAATQEFVV